MTVLNVQAGACGCTARVTARKVDDRHVQVLIESDCEQVVAMNADLTQLQWKGKGHEVFGRLLESAVYRSASDHIRHTACPVPSAILKAIEVEVGAAVPADVSFVFVPPATPGEGDAGNPSGGEERPPSPRSEGLPSV
jgi:hypothetical protein